MVAGCVKYTTMLEVFGCFQGVVWFKNQAVTLVDLHEASPSGFINFVGLNQSIKNMWYSVSAFKSNRLLQTLWWPVAA